MRYDLVNVVGVPLVDLAALIESAVPGGTWSEYRNSRGYLISDLRIEVTVPRQDLGFGLSYGIGRAESDPTQNAAARRVFEALCNTAPHAGFELRAEDDSVVLSHPTTQSVA